MLKKPAKISTKRKRKGDGVVRRNSVRPVRWPSTGSNGEWRPKLVYVGRLFEDRYYCTKMDMYIHDINNANDMTGLDINQTPFPLYPLLPLFAAVMLYDCHQGRSTHGLTAE